MINKLAKVMDTIGDKIKSEEYNMNKVKEFFSGHGDTNIVLLLGSYAGFIVLKRLKKFFLPKYLTGRIESLALLIVMIIWSLRFGIITAARYEVIIKQIFIKTIFQTKEKEEINGED